MLVMRAGEAGDGITEKVEPITKCIDDVLKRYQDVMPEDLPNELPPRQKMDYKIKVKPGTEPPSKAPDRLSQKELEELKSQVDHYKKNHVLINRNFNRYLLKRTGY